MRAGGHCAAIFRFMNRRPCPKHLQISRAAHPGEGGGFLGGGEARGGMRKHRITSLDPAPETRRAREMARGTGNLASRLDAPGGQLRAAVEKRP